MSIKYSETPALNFRDVDLKRLVISNMMKKDHGMSTTPLYQRDGQAVPEVLCIQTPPMRTPFGLSNNTKMKTYQAGQPVRWGIDASFDGYLTGFKNEPLMKEFYDLMRNIEEFGVQLAACNSVEWLGEEADAKAVRFMFNKMIKTGKGDKAKQYAPSIHFQVRPKKDEDGKEKEGEFWTDCKDEDGVAMPLSELPKNATVVMKIKLSSFYFIANKFGFTWDVKWVRVEGRAGERVDDYVPNLYGLSMPALPAPTEQTPVESANKREHSADSEEAAAESNATESNAPPATTAGGKRVKRAA